MSLIMKEVSIWDLRPAPLRIQSQSWFARFAGGAKAWAPLRPAAFLLLILLCLGLVLPVGGQIIFADIPLRVSPQGELVNFWRVRGAGLRETLTETSGHLQLENISGSAIDRAVFYGEYFDAEGRFCFSLAFSQAKNILKKGPIASGEVRELYSSGVDLFTASEPKEVRLYLAQQRRAGQPNLLGKWDVSFRAPVTVIGSPDLEASKLQLDSGLVLSKEPLLDLLLARVSVDQRGLVERVDVLDAASGKQESWLVSFIQQLTFWPATDNGIPKPGQALVLVRALLSEEGVRDYPFPPRISPWIKSYVGRLTDTEVPPVTDIIFRRPTGKVNRAATHEHSKRPPVPPDLFKPLLAESYWSVPAFRMVFDPSAPHHMRRELVGSH